MLRLSRRFTTVLLWLSIALLPVRVGAAVWMPVVMGGMASSAVAQAPVAASLPSSLPEALPHAEAATRVASRQPEALFRPPRSTLA